jgi:hypothetical protein
LRRNSPVQLMDLPANAVQVGNRVAVFSGRRHGERLVRVRAIHSDDQYTKLDTAGAGRLILTHTARVKVAKD